jgi:chaperonin GroEL (HSP60 family)
MLHRWPVQMKIDLYSSLCQVLVELAKLQDREVGEGTTSVVIIATELLKVSSASNSPS